VKARGRALSGWAWPAGPRAGPAGAELDTDRRARHHRGKHDCTGEHPGTNAPARRPDRRGCTRRFERCILLEDPPLEPSQLGARLEADLFREPATERLVGGECVPRPVGAVEAKHQLAKQALLEGILADELLELADQLRAAAERQLSVDPSLQRE